MNVIDYGDLDFVRSETATLAQVFSHTAVLAPPSYLAGETGGNFVLVASNGRIPLDRIVEAIAARGGTEAPASVEDFIGEADPLIDDHAPVDQMIDRP